MVQACRQLREWEVNDRSGSPMNVMVNVSARQFADARLANDIQDALQQTGIDPSRLQLEMTEKIASGRSQVDGYCAVASEAFRDQHRAG
jgi:EAL domain-containing protein (putative c-di-GMP-specific phosphodiesterase class I)